MKTSHLFLILIAVSFILTAGHAVSQQTGDNAMETELAGTWQGVISAGGQDLRLVFHFAKNGDIWTATADSPDASIVCLSAA